MYWEKRLEETIGGRNVREVRRRKEMVVSIMRNSLLRHLAKKGGRGRGDSDRERLPVHRPRGFGKVFSCFLREIFKDKLDTQEGKVGGGRDEE